MKSAIASVLLGVVASSTPEEDEALIISVFKDQPGFLWGAATAAAQIEGAWNEDGKQPSIWDDFCHSIPHRDSNMEPFDIQCGKFPPGESDSRWVTPEVTDDFYHRYESDLKLLSSYGLNSMRVSISWPRIMPWNEETQKHEPNPIGIKWYQDVFAEMQRLGITPFVTLFHWDLPNDLSWLEDSVVPAFVEYAELAFKSFPMVKDWATFNEPQSVCSLGYAQGWFAPGHQETTGAVRCSHHILQAHALAVESFRRMQTDGQIGIVLDYKFAYPLTDSEDDRRAAAFDRDNVVGIFAEPIFLTGDYPQSLKDWYGSQMPQFTEAEKALLKGSADFFGLNTYGGKYATWNNKALSEFNAGDDVVERYSFSPCDGNHDDIKAQLADAEFECGADSGWLWAKPVAMRDYLEWVANYLQASKIYVTEYGCDVKDESSLTQQEALKDEYREEYYRRYTKQIALAKSESSVPVAGVFAWSLMDNFEWHDGLNFRFGITYVNFTDMTRTPKQSAMWWQSMMQRMSESPTVVV
jgi:beta-glucosidase/6-phospho-beta-glucosidase/beta-galactosidase